MVVEGVVLEGVVPEEVVLVEDRIRLEPRVRLR